MRGCPQRGAELKKPIESLNSSSIQKYLKEANPRSPKSPAQESGQQGGKDKKKDPGKNKGDHGGLPREEAKDTGLEEENGITTNKN